MGSLQRTIFLAGLLCLGFVGDVEAQSQPQVAKECSGPQFIVIDGNTSGIQVDLGWWITYFEARANGEEIPTSELCDLVAHQLVVGASAGQDQAATGGLGGRS